MPLSSKNYSDVLDGIEALAGVSSFTTSEQTGILANVNRRIYQAWAASPLWQRYFISGQARPSTDGVIATTYDAASGVRTASSATRSGETVTIVTTAAVDFVAGMSVTVSGLSGTVDPNVTAKVLTVSKTTVDNDTFTYKVTTTNTADETYTGTGTITPVEIPGIEDFFQVFEMNPNGGTYSILKNFWVDADGAHVVGNYEDLNGFYVSFKRDWGGPYTADSADIPQEFFNYAVHGGYADFLRSEGQTDKAFAEEQAAETYLTIELNRADKTANANRYTQFRTHLSQANFY